MMLCKSIRRTRLVFNYFPLATATLILSEAVDLKETQVVEELTDETPSFIPSSK